MWILIIIALTGDGNAIESVRFSNEAACMRAKDSVLLNMQPWRTNYGETKAFCYPEHLEE
jgi:hypothetical protein